MDTKQEKITIQSIKRAVDILRLFENNTLLRITDISNMTGLHKSTVFGIINTLKQLGLLDQDPESGLYCLGLELYRLGMLVNMSLSKVCKPFLEKLVNDIQETVNLVVPRASDIFILEKIESPHSMRICTHVGQMLPLYCTATGKLMLAFMPPEEAEKALESLVFSPHTKNTITSKKELQCVLPGIRMSCVAYDMEEFEAGLISIAAPIIKADRMIGAISISGPTLRMDKNRCHYIEMKLLESTQRINKLLS